MGPSDPYVMPDHLSLLDNHPIGQGGGILINEGSGLPEGYIRHAFWRSEKDDQTVRNNDVKPLHLSTKESSLGTQTFENVSAGSELELFAWNPETMSDWPVSVPDSPFINHLKQNGDFSSLPFNAHTNIFEEDPKTLDVTDELMKPMMEINFPHSNSDLDNALI